jgi:hypothetical protein
MEARSEGELALMGELELITLDGLPDQAILHICESLPAEALGLLCCTCVAFNHVLKSEESRLMWEQLCRTHGLLPKQHGAEDSKACFGKHMASLCTGCRNPTKYIFALTGQRLCEACEARSPESFGLATVQMLVHDCSMVSSLSNSQRRTVFAQIPSLQIADATWYRRRQAVQEARALIEAQEEEQDVRSGTLTAGWTAVAGLSATLPTDGEPGGKCKGKSDDGGEAEGEGEGEGEDEGEDEGEGDMDESNRLSADALAEEWDRAAAEHRARRKDDVAARNQERDAKKSHKRRIKAEQKARRAAGLASALPVRSRDQGEGRGRPPPASAPVHKPRRTSCSERRATCRPVDGWSAELARLETVLGPDLCGLSGLILAKE